MQRLFSLGEITAAASEYDAHASSAPYSATLLRAHIHLKKGDHAAARALLQTKPPARDPEAQTRRALLSGMAHVLDGRFDVADEEFARAEGLLAKSGDRELSAQLAHRRLMRYAADGKIARAQEYLAAARAGSSLETYVNAAFGEQYILSRQLRFREQAEVNLRILERLGLTLGDQEEARIHAVWNVAILAREIHLPDALEIVHRHIDARPWPADWTRHRFETLKALGWSHALRGDYFNAFRWLKHALAQTSDDGSDDARARRCVAHLDRAYLARSNGERIFERQEIEEAAELADSVRWNAIDGEERVALLLLAELFATIDVGRATYYIAKYDGLPTATHRYQHFSGDERAQHLANYSRSVVDVASGHKKSAAALLKKAYSFYERVEYSWRAGRCALRLRELTNDERWSARAREMLRNYSASWLAKELHQKDPASALGLPPMQRKVFDGICRGLSNADIAEELGRAEFTVRNHVKELFKRFNVNSRSALIAQAMKRNLL